LYAILQKIAKVRAAFWTIGVLSVSHPGKAVALWVLQLFCVL
jgi:hypothetical protein